MKNKISKKLKATVSLILTLAMLLSMCALMSFAAESPLKIFVASDIHYISPERLPSTDKATVTVPGDEMYFYADYMGKMFQESLAIVYSLLSEFEASDSNVLILTGDMINDGYISDHESIARVLKAFEVRTGKRIIVTSGNHDITSDDAATPENGLTSLEDFRRIYADLGYNEALSKDETSYSYTTDLGPGYRLINIDSNDYGKTAGDISEATFKWVEQQVIKAKEEGVHLVGAMHHSLLDHFTLQSTFVGGFDTYGIDNLATAFADWGIKYMLTGHLHVTDITMATTDKGNKIYDVATGSLISAGCNYRVLTLSHENVKIETKGIESIDAQYLKSGYTEKQLQKLTTDFQGYSREYCAAGLNYWVDHFLGAEKLAVSLKLQEGTLAYKALDSMLGHVRRAITLPLYDRAGTPEVDSLSEVAALAGYTVPESQYEGALDVAAIYVISFFSGEPSVKADSLETQVILAAVKGAIAYAVGQMLDDSEQSKLLYALFKHMGVPAAGLENGQVVTTEMARLTYMQTAANAIVKVAITPILDSISYDAYAPEDLNVTLEPYGAKPSYSAFGNGGQPMTFLQKLVAFLEYLFALLMQGMSLLKK